jgi:hypothetical protein
MPVLCYFALLRALLRQIPPSTQLSAECLTMLDHAVSVYAVPAATMVDTGFDMEKQQQVAVQCVGLYALHLLMLRQRREADSELAMGTPLPLLALSASRTKATVPLTVPCTIIAKSGPG